MSQPFHYLTSEQRESLRGLPFSVLLPTELPQGWRVEEFTSDAEEDGASFTLGIGKGKARLNFLATNEGIGDPPGGMKRTRHQHPQLGEIKVEHEEDGDFLSDWIEVDGGWFAVGGSDTLDVDLDALIPLLATAP